jgi:hypothetical protein
MSLLKFVLSRLGDDALMTGMIPMPPQRPRSGFPWVGLMVAIMLLAALIANWMGGSHGMLIAAIYYGVIAGPIALVLILFGLFRQGLKGPPEDWRRTHAGVSCTHVPPSGRPDMPMSRRCRTRTSTLRSWRALRM